ncbi:MAG: hypothetical protein U0X93_06930 [Anaerolineales bacterium]
MSLLIPLLLAALTYTFGASIADYLGKPFLVAPFWLGLLIVLLAQTITSLLPEVFRLDAEPLLENETRAKRQVRRNNLLYTSLACIVVIALTAYILFINNSLPLSSSSFFSSPSLSSSHTPSLPSASSPRRGRISPRRSSRLRDLVHRVHASSG